MVPGSYAFRAVIGAVQLMRSAGGSPAYLLPQTASLVITTVILTAAIAIGLAIPLILPLNISQGTQRAKSGL
jgi:uncharacterized membrane protein YjjB (DUF3815 family)